MVNIRNTREYIENFLWIQPKVGDIVPFCFNPAQNSFYERIKELHEQDKPIRMIVLKARQLGFSTLIEAIFYKKSATQNNINTQIVAHREDSTAQLFRMNKLFYEMSPSQIRPMLSASNAQELVFENPDKNPEHKARNPGLKSKIRCNTAGGGGIGRSLTIQCLHASEFAFWSGDVLETWTGLIQAVPSQPGTMAIIESTANGFNEFKDIWDGAVKGENDFIPVFFAWFDNPEYSMPVPDGTVWTQAELEMRERYGLTDEQLQWRRWCIRNNCANDERKFRQEYPSNPDEAFLTSGAGIFDNEVVMLMRERAAKNSPLHIGEFEYDYDEISITNIRWEDKPDGCIRIYKDPKKNRPYVLGGDTAGEGSDCFTGLVIDNITGKHCAVLQRQYDEAAYARQIYCLGMHYKEALIGLETNFSTFPTMELQRLRYPKMYVRETPDNYTGKPKQSFGFRTDGKTRPVIIAELVEMFTNHPDHFVDFEMLGEMLTFVKSEKGKPEALEGKHDDLVMAAAITYGIRNQQSFTKTNEDTFSMADWPKDVIEDYERSNETERARIRSIYCGKKETNDDE